MRRQSQKTEKRDMSQSAREIAEHVMAILNHPDCPKDLEEGIYQAILELNDNGNVIYQPGYVESVLAQHLEDKQKGVR